MEYTYSPKFLQSSYFPPDLNGFLVCLLHISQVLKRLNVKLILHLFAKAMPGEIKKNCFNRLFCRKCLYSHLQNCLHNKIRTPFVNNIAKRMHMEKLFSAKNLIIITL